MIYAISDIHGNYEKFQKLLKKIHFSDDDILYVLGDVTDRGTDGILIYLEMMRHSNIIFIIGNHDLLALKIITLLYDESNLVSAEELKELINLWISDGGKPTLKQFFCQEETDKQAILQYISNAESYVELKVNDREFLLAHTVPSKKRMLSEKKCGIEEFTFGKPEYDKVYFPNKYIITGHTPTGFIDRDYMGKIFKQNNHIVIDCGVAFGNSLGCICLDTLEEIYVD